MTRSRISRHGHGSRALAFWLIAAQFILFTAHGLAHAHSTPAAADLAASTPHRGPTVSGTPAGAATLHRVGESASAECPICRVAQGTVTSTFAVQSMAFLAALCGQIPARSLVYPPALVLGPSSARAPPTL